MKKALIGSIGLTAALCTVAVVGLAPTYAANETAWHEVKVDVASEIILGGNVSSTTTLSPKISDATAATSVAGALTVQSNVGWKLQYQAVTGDETAASTTAATGTNLGTAGFTNTGGYAYAGADTIATTGNQWGAQFAVAGTGVTKAVTALTVAGLTNVATGTATSDAAVTPTYSAFTDGTAGTSTYYGTIYYVLSTNP